MNRSANVNTIDLLFSQYRYISCQVKVRVLCSIEIRNCWLFQTHTMQLAWRIVLHLHSTNPLYAETHHVLLLHPSLLKVISLSYLPLSRERYLQKKHHCSTSTSSISGVRIRRCLKISAKKGPAKKEKPPHHLLPNSWSKDCKMVQT